MNIYILDIGIIVACALLLLSISWGLRRLRMKRYGRVYMAVLDGLMEEIQLHRRITGTALKDAVEFAGNPRGKGSSNSLYRLVRSEYRRTTRTLIFINLATTVIAAVPVVAAVVSLVQNRPNQALNYDLAGVALLIVTKGGLFLLTFVLFPIVKGIPTIAAGIAIRSWWDNRNKSKTPPTSKPAA